MFKQMRLGAKIACIAAVLIVLACIVAGAGYWGMAGVVNRVTNADAVDGMARDTLIARQHEKNFIMRGDPQYVDKVKAQVAKVASEAEETKVRFKQKINQDQMDLVISEIRDYGGGGPYRQRPTAGG